MSTATSLCTVLTALSLLLPACGGSASASSAPGPKADATKTTGELQAEVKTADKPVLEQAVTAYNSFIASKQDELKTLEAQLKEQAGNALDAVLGEGKSDTVKAEVDALKANVESLRKDLEALRAKLEVYVKELAARG